MQSWLGICMLLAGGFGFCLARIELKQKKDGKIIAAAVLLLVGMIVIASRYTLEADPGNYQRTAVIDSWSGEQVATIHRKHQDPPAQ
jgi:prolipoprotein diacylglyceryltransferase